VRRATIWAAGVAALLGGCASTPSRETGVRIGDETLKQFKAGVTTEGWLTAVLGEPTSWAEVEGVENTKVFRYATGESSGGLASLFTGGWSKNRAVTYFIISEGVVTRFWADREVEYTLLGKPVEQPTGEKQD
jgi:hypothetical protein